MHICSEGISLGSGPPKSCQKLLDLKGLWGSFQNIPKCQTQAFLAPWLCGPDSRPRALPHCGAAHVGSSLPALAA